MLSIELPRKKRRLAQEKNSVEKLKVLIAEMKKDVF
jgi:hypothetical protein